MRRKIRLTESDLRRIVNKSVRRALNEELEEGFIGNFFNNFRRSNHVSDAAPKGQRHRYKYNDKTGTYWYKDDAGNQHNTNVGYENGRVGSNWNPFGASLYDGKHQVSNGDLATAQGQLRNWHRNNADSINQGNARAEQERQTQARRQSEDSYSYDRPHRTGWSTDQAGHTRAYFDDDAAYDAGLR